MIRTNLSVLLAERGLKAKKVSRDTGISQTTLTSLVNNTGKGIQFDTIDTLCRYLGVSPEEFFEYYPFRFKFQAEKTDFNLIYKTNEFYDFVKLSSLTFKFDMVIEIIGEKENDIDASCVLEQNKFNGEYEVEIEVDTEEEEKFLKKILTDMPISFKRDFNRLVFASIDKELKKSYEEWKVNANMNVDAIEYDLDKIINDLDYFMTFPMI